MSNEKQIQILEDKREKINKVSPCFCSAKWLQTTLYLQNGYNHSCHHPSPHKIPLEEIKENPAALHNSKFKKEQRKKMLKGIRPKECSFCWEIEDLNKGYFSDRHHKTSDINWAWDRFEEISNLKGDEDITPSYLEISFSNNCNFGCSYCSPEISSKWMDDVKTNGIYPMSTGSHDLNYLKRSGKMPYERDEENPYIEAFWKWFPEVLPKLKVLRITGGEPTLSSDTWKLLDFLIDNPKTDLNIAINSNLGVHTKLIDKLIEKVNKLKSLGITVDIYTSLENTGKQAEYSRDGLVYNDWLKNIRHVLNETESTVIIMTTINILTLPSFTDFVEVVMQLRTEYNFDFAKNRIPLSINLLHWPQYLQCNLLDIDKRKEFADNIEKTCEGWLKYYSKEKYARLYLEEWDQIKSLCDNLRTSKVSVKQRKDFISFINAFDKRRNKVFDETFPMYKYFKKEWNA